MSAPDEPAGVPSSANPGSMTGTGGTPVAVAASRVRARDVAAVFLAGPVIWSVHFMVVYLVAEAGCTGDGPGLEVFDPPVPTVVTLAATVVAALACLAAAAWGQRRWRAYKQERGHGAGLEPPDLGGSLAFAGALLSLLGFVTVLYVGLTALVLPAC
jgi:hypothetical protein